jgi:hypothetical protein
MIVIVILIIAKFCTNNSENDFVLATRVRALPASQRNSAWQSGRPVGPTSLLQIVLIIVIKPKLGYK